MNNTTLNPIPENHNRISVLLATKYTNRLKPENDETREILTDLILAFGVSEDLHGIYHALYYMLSKFSHQTFKISKLQQREIIHILETHLHELDPPKNVTNLSIKFHINNHTCETYPKIGGRLHKGIVGKNLQVKDQENHYELLSNAITPVNSILKLLVEADLFDLDNSIKFQAHLDIIIRQRLPDLKENTYEKYVLVFCDILYNRYNNKKFSEREKGYKKIISETDSKIAKTFDSTLSKKIDWKFIKRVQKTIALTDSNDGLAPESFPLKQSDPRFIAGSKKTIARELLEINPKISRDPSKLSESELTKLDQIPSISDPDILALDTITIILKILQSSTFITDELNRSTGLLLFCLMLMTRRPLKFLFKLQFNSIENLNKGSFLDLSNNVICYKPSKFFGRPETILKKISYEKFLKTPGGRMLWNQIFEGYETLSLYGSIPIIQFLRDLFTQHLKLIFPHNSHNPEKKIFLWRDENKIREFKLSDWNRLMRGLTSELRKYKTDHRSLGAALIKRSFDAYHSHGGLNKTYMWYISERWRFTEEMPIRYTLVTLHNLTREYFKASNTFITLLNNISENELQLPLSRVSQIDYMPNDQMGSWHLLDPRSFQLITETITNVDFYKQKYPSLKKRALRHNKIVFETCLLLGILDGLRDFEVPQIIIDPSTFRTKTLAINGKGQMMRVIPLHESVLIRLAEIYKRRENQTQKLFYYSNNGEAKILTTKTLNTFFKDVCKYAGLEDLDFYGLRHLFRTELFNLHMDEAEINYLMGHRNMHDPNFSKKTLNNKMIANYLEKIEKLITKLDLERFRTIT